MRETNSSQQQDGNRTRMKLDILKKLLTFLLSFVITCTVYTATDESSYITFFAVYLLALAGCYVFLLVLGCSFFQLNRADLKCLIVMILIPALLGLGLLAYDNHIDLSGSSAQSCWQNVEYRLKQLSDDVDVWKSNFLDAFLSHGLLTVGKHKKLVSETFERLANAEVEQKYEILNSIDFRLLTELLPTTADEGYVCFCDILRTKSNLSDFGIDLCKKCSLCCSRLLNGQFENNVCVLPQVPVKSTSGSLLPNRLSEIRVAQFIMDASCKVVFDKKVTGIRSFLKNWNTNVTVLDNKLGVAELESYVVAVAPHNFSLICFDSRISVEMTVPLITLVEIDRQGLKWIFAKAASVPVTSSQLELHFISLPQGSLILLNLSPKSGFELLAIFGSSRRQKRFTESLGTTFHTHLKRIHVQLQVSALPQVEILVEPSGGFRFKERATLDVTFKQAVICITLCLLTLLLGFAGGWTCHKFGMRSKLGKRDDKPRQLAGSERDRDKGLPDTEPPDVDEKDKTADNTFHQETRVRALPQSTAVDYHVEPSGIIGRDVVTDARAADDQQEIDAVDNDPSGPMDSHIRNRRMTTTRAFGNRQCKEDDIRKIYHKVSLYWYKLGVELRVPDYKLDQIKKNEKSDDERCYKMLKSWLNQGLDTVTIYTLLNAIREIDGPIDAIEDSGFDRSMITSWKTSLANRQQDDTYTAS